MVKTEEDIEQEFYDLLNDYMASSHGKKRDVIIKAYNFAKKAHGGIRRLSGEPYIVHPLAVARICCTEIGLGSTSICAALLHDVIEDTEYTIDDIRAVFGSSIADLVEGISKISGGIFGEKSIEQAENFSKLVISMSEDIRVILIKIADRLHNMRRLDAQTTDKQMKIACETEYIYAPLCHRLGLFAIKTELENLCFKYNFPAEYDYIQRRLDAETNKRIGLYNKFAFPITTKLDELGYKYEMKKRIKSPHSIFKKMQTKHIPFEEVYDILGSRIVFDPEPDADEKLECWKIYNIITSIYKPHPNRTRDWLSNPKTTGYEALHVTVMGPEGYWIEVQIRSRRMDDIAEKGLAAHWNYKKDYSSSENKIEEWLNTVNELLKSPDSNAMKLLESFKISQYESEFFVFTPKGDIKSVPAHSTVLDFAFSIHTDIGCHAIGAKVNNKIVPLNYELHSGDQVEILTSEKQTPKAEWIDYVSTAKIKDKLCGILKIGNHNYRALGDEKLREALFAAGYSIKKSYTPDIVSKLLKGYKRKNWDALLTDIGNGVLSLEDLPAIIKRNSGQSAFSKWIPKFIKGDTVPDAIRNVSIPETDVKSESSAVNGNKVLAALVEIKGIARKRMLLDIATVISDTTSAYIEKADLSTDNGLFCARLSLYVSDSSEIKSIYNSLSNISGIESVTRIEL